MAKAKPIQARLHELTSGQYADFFAVLAERTKSATRDGKPFYTCRFRDAKRTATFMVWADGGWFEKCEKEWSPGAYYKVRGKYVEHDRYGPQVEVEQVRDATDADRIDGFDPAEFAIGSRHSADAMFGELRRLVEESIGDEPLRRLVLTILDHHAEPLKRLPATQRNFYPFPGGLLEHILSVTHTCLHLAQKYGAYYAELSPPLNRDVVVAGAALHDIGRVLEFAGDPLLVQRTVPGGLFGHVFLGRDLVRDTAREQGDVNPELVQLVEHVIVAHLNHPEWGSPRLPVIPEVLIVHHADDLDAKLEMYARCLRNDQAAGPFTDRDPVLGKQLFKGRSV